MDFTEERLARIITIAQIIKENPDMPLESISRDAYLKSVKDLTDLNTDINKTDYKLFELRNQRQDLFEPTNSLTNDIINLIKIYFGDNSKELKQTGRKVKSDRKKYVRKTLDEKILEADENLKKLKEKKALTEKKE